MSRIIIISLISLISIYQNLYGQCQENNVQLRISENWTLEPNEQFCFNIEVDNFQDITLFFFVINFNSTTLQLASWDPSVSGLNGFTVQDVTAPTDRDPDVIRVLWAHPLREGTTLSNNSSLLELCFNVIGDPGDIGNIYINNTGLGSPAEFLKLDNASLSVCNPDPDNGTVFIVPPTSDNPQLFATRQCSSDKDNSIGSAQFKVFYGSPPYTIVSTVGNIVGSDNQDTFVYNDLPPGSYSFSVIDRDGLASEVITIEITEDPPLSVEFQAIDLPNCPSAFNGSIELSVSGGIPFDNGQYFFDWGQAQIGLGQNELRSLSNGTYDITIIDSLGCNQDQSVTLQRTPIVLNVTETIPAFCEGRNNGIIRVSASGGGPFTEGYIWTLERIEDDGSSLTISVIANPEENPEFRLLKAGNYRITAQDSVDVRNTCSTQVNTVVDNTESWDYSTTTLNSNDCEDGSYNVLIELINENENFFFPYNILISDLDGNPIYDIIINESIAELSCLKPDTYLISFENSEACVQMNTIEIFDIIQCDRPRDSLALVALYNATDGPNWTNTWDLSTPMDGWFGVTLSEDGCVSGISMYGDGDFVNEAGETGNNLTGEIPPEIGNLQNLTELWINNNSLSGEIPPEIGNLTNLTSLYLYNNSLSGTIPTEIGNLTNLTRLYLNDNSLSGTIPTEIGNLTNLTQLYLYNNSLSGTIPTEIGNLTNLTQLRLSNNSLSGTIPTEIGNLTNLIQLYLNDNSLSGTIPTEIGNLTNLTSLYLYNNSLSGTIPTEIGNLTNLTLLWLYSNNLTGEIPTELGNLTNLTTLSLSDNNLTGEIPLELGNLTNLITLSLSDNNLTGEIPLELGNLTNLNLLWLYSNSLTGEIPLELGNLMNLTTLSLYSNNLTGEIPTELGNLTNLTSLYLFSNDLTGGIPTELGNLTNLTTLSLYSNNLTGEIPTELGNLTNLTRLYIQDNQLEGCIPPELMVHCDLGFSTNINATGYNLSNNQGLPWQGDFSRFCAGEEQIGAACDDGDPDTTDDVITAECGCMGELIVVNECRERDSLALVALYNSTDGPNWTTTWDLSTPMEEWYGVHLDEGGCVICLDLNGQNDCNYFGAGTGNNLIGEIPLEFYNLLNIETILLNKNQLTGELNELVGEFKNLITLNLASNDLSGVIPKSIGELSALISLTLSNNQFSGVIPIELGQLLNLQDLNLGVNVLSGEVPKEIGSLVNLTRILLTSNLLEGSLPQELGDLTNLRFLYCGNNRLTDSIPLEIGKLQNLVHLYLDDNLLTGSIPESIGNLNQLVILRLESNELTGSLPPQIGNLISLDELTLSSNNLSGQIPAEIGNLNNLTQLYLFDNSFTNEIPSEIGNLTNLTQLRLNFNLFSGKVPSEIGNLNNLTVLYLNNNSLDGCIPESFSMFCLDDDTRLHNNPGLPWQGDFSRFCAGEDQIGAPCDDGDPETTDDVITAECGCMGELIVVNECRERDSLALVALYNATDGPNWTTTWDLSTPMDVWYGVTLSEEGCVRFLNLTNNGISGEIPTDIGNLQNLTTLRLDNNSLSGEIPPELANLQNLTQLYLSNNSLSGEIPTEIGNLQNLTTLLLDNNSLTGEIPTEIGNLTSLTRLYLLDNSLSGEIPMEFGNLTNLIQLYLSSNMLTGEVPSEIGNLTNLTNLLLNNNSLTGEIPTEIGNLQNLTQLWLQNNQLEGCIPQDLSSFCDIDYDLSNNPDLPWQGDFSRFCAGEDQIGAPCDDGDPETTDDVITVECGCMGELIVVNECRERDSLALVALYNATDGPNWTYDDIAYKRFVGNGWFVNDSVPNYGIIWDSSSPISTWHGVELNENGCVAGLHLLSNGLKGELVDIDLPQLTYLSLYSNEFSGNLIDFQNMPSLEYLHLGSNELSGAIPDFTNFRQLRTLILNNNELVGELFEFSNLKELSSLDLNNNELSGLAIGFDSMTNLVSLGYSGNSISGPIPSFSALTELVRLYLDRNELIGILPTFENNPELRVISLGGNQLSGEIPLYTNLPHLFYLLLFNNNFTGEVPDYSGFYNLNQFHLSGNELTGSFPQLDSLPNLESLFLNRNSITGTIPESFGNLNALKSMYLSDNDLTGTLPESFKSLSNLQFLILNNNSLEGTLPEVFDSLTMLQSVNLSNNLFSGKLAESLGSLQNVYSINFSNNNFEGCYPESYSLFCTIRERLDSTSVIFNTVSFENNIALSWRGDFEQFFCDSDNQTGAPCDDSDPTTQNDRIRSDCSCRGSCSELLTQSITICEGEEYTIGSSRYTVAGTYDDIFPSELACDTIIRTELSVIPNNLSVAIDDSDEIIYTCEDSYSVSSMSSGSVDIDLLWTSDTPIGITTSNNGTTVALSDLSPGLNTITLEGMTLDQCAFIDADQILIYREVAPQPEADLNTTAYESIVDIADPSMNDGMEGVSGTTQLTLDNTMLPGGTWTATGDRSWEWIPEPGCMGTFSIPYTICNDACSDLCADGSIIIEITQPTDLNSTIPNSISPNGDGYNDTFVIPVLKSFPQNYPENNLTIFNRWGQVMYQESGYANGWRGINASGDDLPVGTYYYTWDPGNGEDINKGRVAILR